MDPDRSHPAPGTDRAVLSQTGGEVEARRIKRKEQNRLAQRRHREKSKGEHKRRELDVAHTRSSSRPSHCRRGPENARYAAIADSSSQSSTSTSISASTGSSAYQRHSASSSPLSPGTAMPDLLDWSVLPPLSLPTSSTDSRLSRCDALRGEGLARWGSLPAEATRRHGAHLTTSNLKESLGQLQGAIGPVRAAKNRDGVAPKTQPIKDRVPSWLAAQSNRDAVTAQDASNGCTSYSGLDPSTALREFFAMVSANSPWTDTLLDSNWDLPKVLSAAAERLGLLSQYVEADESISFLAVDYHGLQGQQVSASPLDFLSRSGIDVRNDTKSILRWNIMPSNMIPSDLSSVVSHHPYVDLSFPWPSVRDKILAATAAGLLSAHAVCVEVWPSSDLQEQGAEPPYWVHGDDPFDPEAYELSDRFARNLGCLLDPTIIKRTNWWRRQQNKRGLPPKTLHIAESFAPFLAHHRAHLLSPLEISAPDLCSSIAALLPPSHLRGKLVLRDVSALGGVDRTGLMDWVPSCALEGRQPGADHCGENTTPAGSSRPIMP